MGTASQYRCSGCHCFCWTFLLIAFIVSLLVLHGTENNDSCRSKDSKNSEETHNSNESCRVTATVYQVVNLALSTRPPSAT